MLRRYKNFLLRVLPPRPHAGVSRYFAVKFLHWTRGCTPSGGRSGNPAPTGKEGEAAGIKASVICQYKVPLLRRYKKRILYKKLFSSLRSLRSLRFILLLFLRVLCVLGGL